MCNREMEATAKRASQQQELLNGRIAELDAESRKLRDQKYQLDTQVRWLSPGRVLHVMVIHAVLRNQSCHLLICQAVLRVRPEHCLTGNEQATGVLTRS